MQGRNLLGLPRLAEILIASLPACLLLGCGGGDSSNALCQSIGPNVNGLVFSGNIDNLEAAADRNLGSFATLNAEGAGSYISSQGNSFGAGNIAGAFITPPSGSTAADITVATFMTQEQATVESATGSTLTVTPTDGDPAAQFVSFATTLPFDGVRVGINTFGGTQLLVYEICGNGAVRR